MRRGGRRSREHSNTRTLTGLWSPTLALGEAGCPTSGSHACRSEGARSHRWRRSSAGAARCVSESAESETKKNAHGQVSCRLADWIVQIRLEAPTSSYSSEQCQVEPAPRGRQAGRPVGPMHGCQLRIAAAAACAACMCISVDATPSARRCKKAPCSDLSICLACHQSAKSRTLKSYWGAPRHHSEGAHAQLPPPRNDGKIALLPCDAASAHSTTAASGGMVWRPLSYRSMPKDPPL